MSKDERKDQYKMKEIFETIIFLALVLSIYSPVKGVDNLQQKIKEIKENSVTRIEAMETPEYFTEDVYVYDVKEIEEEGTTRVILKVLTSRGTVEYYTALAGEVNYDIYFVKAGDTVRVSTAEANNKIIMIEEIIKE